MTMPSWRKEMAAGRPVFGRPMPKVPSWHQIGPIDAECQDPAATRGRALPMADDPGRWDGTPCYRCVANHAPAGAGRVACHLLRGTAHGCRPEDDR